MKMKNWLAFAAIATLVTTTACEDETPDPVASYSISEATLEGAQVMRITGTINEDVTLTNGNNYSLSGGVFVANGATLTIEAGTTIYGETGGASTAFLSVLKGGKINAVGTASSPIVMTSSNELSNTASARGDWGGVIVNGNATINTGATATGEGGTGEYGGTDDSDNSGTIKYVRVEYAGKQLGPDNELNGFSFNGVGSGTTIEFIQSYMGADDGIEFFGGTVNLKYAVSSGSGDDSFDWTDGWRGNGQFWVVHQAADAGDRGIEADNRSSNPALEPISNPTIANLTIVGANHNDGVRLRAGTSATIWNAIVTGARDGVEVKADEVNTVALRNFRVFSNIFNYTDDEGNAKTSGDIKGDTASALAAEAGNNFTTGSVSLTGFVGTEVGGSTPAGSFFTTADYIGAVSATNNWTTGWVRGLDGNIIQ